jgi:hypothetical protein
MAAAQHRSSMGHIRPVRSANNPSLVESIEFKANAKTAMWVLF